jgi:hypothetical protein
MRTRIVSTCASRDGLMQAPGGPEADATGGFTLGGWMFDYVPGGDIQPASCPGVEPGEKEFAGRKRMAKETR